MVKVVSFILAACVAHAAPSQQPPAPGSTAALDYEVFKTQVQPILTTARKGNARCIACHSRGGGNSYLEELPPGSTTYTEEQSRRNFERVQRLVVPGEPLKSLLLINPLAEDAGGSHWHGGGKHWQSQDNPEWQVLAAWVRGTSTRSEAAKDAGAPALNFETFKNRVQRLVVPGEPLKSLLLVNPLAEDAGGSHWHGGGKHWQSQNDPEWQILAAWVRGS
jgi:hypothetical protein